MVYEHVSGGGFAGQKIPPSILSEGYGMLKTITSDFHAAGHAVTVLLDARLERLCPPLDADRIISASSYRDIKTCLGQASKFAEAAYVIAPESNFTLQTLVECLEKAGVSSLNCPSNAIKQVSDKVALYKTLNQDMSMPKTIPLNIEEDEATTKRVILKELDFPFVLKPIDGVGCSGLSIIQSERQISYAVRKIKEESTSKRFIAQELVSGIDASVSLIAVEYKAVPISLNKQNLSLGTPENASSYNGGIVPFDSALKQKAFEVATNALSAFGNLRGYVGVDMVLSDGKPVLIEVNPRLTTSYVGLRERAMFNPAQAIIDAALEKKITAEQVHSVGYTAFSKVETPLPTDEAVQATYSIGAVVSPPFPVLGNDTACALISSNGVTLNKATRRLSEIKGRLLNIIETKNKHLKDEGT